MELIPIHAVTVLEDQHAHQEMYSGYAAFGLCIFTPYIELKNRKNPARVRIRRSISWASHLLLIHGLRILCIFRISR